MAFRLILILEPIMTELTSVLFLHFVDPRSGGKFRSACDLPGEGCLLLEDFEEEAYRRSSGLSNFFGFLGQHSQMYRPLTFELCLALCIVFWVATLRVAVADLLSGGVVEWWRVREEDWESNGLGLSETAVTYGESWEGSRSDVGDTPPGECRSKDEKLVMLLPAADNPVDDA